jgi:hypothetical protein
MQARRLYWRLMVSESEPTPDGDEVIERAKEVIEDAIWRSVMKIQADMMAAQYKIETELFPLIAKVCDQLLEMTKLCEGLDDWEDEQIAAFDEQMRF